MRQSSSDEVRRNFRQVLTDVEEHGEIVSVVRYRHVAAVIVPSDWFEVAEAADASKWRRIADRLAAELADHAFCSAHPVDQPGKDCPWCSNRAAYLAYLAAGGRDMRLAITGTSVSVHELMQQEEGGQS